MRAEYSVENAYGDLRANPHTLVSNPSFAKFEKDEDIYSQPDRGQDDFAGAVAAARMVNSITIGGVGESEIASIVPFPENDFVVTLETPVVVTDMEAVKYGIYNALINNGKMEEFNVYLTVDYDGANLTVSHIGRATVKTITFDDASTLVSTRKTSTRLSSDYTIALAGVTSSIVSGTGSAVLANTPYNFVAVPATDSATATTLQSDMATALTALGFTYSAVAVVVDDLNNVFRVTVTGDRAQDLKHGTVSFAEGNVRLMYV